MHQNVKGGKELQGSCDLQSDGYHPANGRVDRQRQRGWITADDPTVRDGKGARSGSELTNNAGWCGYPAPCRAPRCSVRRATIVLRKIDAAGRPVRQIELCDRHAEAVVARERKRGFEIFERRGWRSSCAPGQRKTTPSDTNTIIAGRNRLPMISSPLNNGRAQLLGPGRAEVAWVGAPQCGSSSRLSIRKSL
jgi:hypothetical protein